MVFWIEALPFDSTLTTQKGVAMKTTTIPRFDDLPDILTVDEAADFLRLGRSSVYESIHAKDIPAVRIGRRLLVPKSGLKQFVDVSEKD